MNPPLDRRRQPPVRPLERLDVQAPRTHVLPNGVTVNVLNAGENEVARVDLLFGGGRWQQSRPLQANFTNRMLREGTRRYTSAELAERLDYYGAWLELNTGAEYSFVSLFSLNKYLPQTLGLLESAVKEPLFPEKELRTLAEIYLQQFRVNCSKVNFLARRALAHALYGGQHPCGRLVQEDDYRRLTPSLLREFYDRYYHSGNCAIYLSGKVDEDCLRRVEQLFGSEPFGKAAALSETGDFPIATAPGRRIFVERGEALQSAVQLGMLTIDRHHPDFNRLRVAATLLGGYFGSRLMSNIRERKGYTYGIFANVYANPGSSLLVIHAETANEHVESLISEVYAELDRLCREPVPESELSMVKNYMLGEMCRSYESAFSLADNWIFIQTSGFDASYIPESLKAIREITPEDILELSRRYLCKENLKEVVCGKKIS